MFLCHSHENSSGYYRTSVYFLSKIFADLLPNRIIPIFLFSAIAYFMMGNTHLRPNLPVMHTVRRCAVLSYHPDFLPSLAGLKPTTEAFLLFALTMSLVSLAGVSLAFLVSASVSTFAMANVLIALPFIFMMVRHQDTYSWVWAHNTQDLFTVWLFLILSGVWWVSCQPQLHAELALLGEMDQHLQIRT